MNRAGLDMLEADNLDEVRRVGFLQFVMPVFREPLEALFQQVCRGESGQMEFQAVGQKGAVRWLEIHATPLRNAANDVTGVVGLSRDITERRRLEDGLRRSEAKLRTLFELSPMGIALTDMQGKYIEFNEAFRAICGYSREELKNLDYWELTPREYFPQEAKQLEALNRTGRYGPFEKEYIRKDGTRIPLLLNGVLVQGSEKEPRVWSIVEDISERKKRDDMIWSQANFDPLTDLPNRRLFQDRLEQEIRKAARIVKPFALFFIDLDRFKEINDTLGHSKGDVLLVETARRIRNCVRSSDTVARLGGDEFTLILPAYGDSIHLERIAQSILEALSMPFVLGKGETGYISASIGIALYPDDAKDSGTLMRHADQAMYSAKTAGRNQFSYFIADLQIQAQEKLHLTTDLRNALSRGEMEVHYQPVIELATDRIHKAEALVRWNHPTRGTVSPALFIPLAEEFGLIHDIGNWVFLQAVATVTDWQHRLGRLIQVSVNRSPVEFEKGSLDWLETLKGSGLPGNSLTIEITEGLLLQKTEKLSQYLVACHNQGIEVSIDDFGTGFSALSYLKQFDIDYLKIDRSFVRDLHVDENDKALVEAIIVMAHKLGIKTIAEGVETEAQRDLLVSFGCDYVQGFLYARPLPAAAFETFLQSWPS